MGTKPPADVDECISKDRRHDSGDISPLSTTTSSLQGRAGGSAITPKLAELVFGPGSNRRAEKPSPSIACTAVAATSVRSRVLVFAGSSAPWRDVAAERPALALLNAVPNISLSYQVPCLTFHLSFEIHPSVRAGQTRVLLLGERGHCPWGQPRSPSVAC